MRRLELIYSTINLVIDVVLLFTTFIFAYYLRFSYSATALPYGTKIDAGDYLGFLSLLVPIWIVIFFVIGVYRIEVERRLFAELSKIFWAVTFSVVITTTFMFVIRNVDFSRLMLIYTWVVAIILLSIYRICFFVFRRFLMNRGIGIKKVLILGENESVNLMKKQAEEKSTCGYRIVKNIEVNGEPTVKEVVSIIEEKNIDEVIQAEPFSTTERNMDLINICQEKQVSFKQIPTLYDLKKGQFDISTLGEVPVLEFKTTPLVGWGRILKRVFDLVFSVLLLLMLTPLFVVVAIVIKVNSTGPVFFRHERVGRRKNFSIFKFRSMVNNAEAQKKKLFAKNERGDGPLFKIKNDPRVTSVGKFLRKTRIDELPQLFNVFKGEMSLVGPRPHLPSEVKLYKKHQRKVLWIKPGITGMSQVSGASDLSFEDEVRLDAYYIDNWSIYLDFIILIKTFGAVFKGEGAV